MRIATPIYDVVIRRPRAALLLCLAFAGLLASQGSFDIDTSLQIWFLEGDPDVQTYDLYVERFETDEFLAIALEAPEVFTPEMLARVQDVGDAVAGVHHTLRVNSLATVEYSTLEEGTLVIRELFAAPPTTAAEAARVRETAMAERGIRDLVSDDGRGTVIIIEHTPFEDLSEKAEYAAEIRSTVEQVLGGPAYRGAGNAFIDEAMQSYIRRDLAVMAPLTGIMIVLVTFLLFRNLWCTLVPSLVVGCTLASTVGLAGLAGVKLNMITTIVIPLSMAVGIADSVHVIAGYRERLQEGLAKAEALRQAWHDLLFPCVITTATTAAGLASLLAANLRPLRQFGWMGAATVVFALFYSLVLIPAVFTMVPAPPAGKAHERVWLQRVLSAVANVAWRRHRLVLVATTALVIVSAIGVSKIEVGADFQSYFLEDDPVFVDARYIDAHLGGTGSVEVMVESDDIRDPAILEAMLTLQALLVANPAVISTDSPANLVAELHETWFDDPARHTVPATLPAVAQLLSQTEGTAMHDGLMTVDYGAARIRGRIRASDYSDLLRALPALEAETARTFDGIAEAKLTGVGKLVANLDTYIIQSQLRSFILAFFVVGVLLALFFRSAHIGLWAVVPNALPILLVLGAMGWIGLPLDVGTVMVASIMLGLIVDDTVHYLARYQLEWGRAGQREDDEARRRTAHRTGMGVGRAIATTSVILACSFWISVVASFKPNVNFGLLCGIATVVALVCDLLALPAVIRAFPLRRPAPPQT